MSNAKTKQIWFFLSSLPLFHRKELSSWLYTTEVSLIEKREREAVISFQVWLSSSQKDFPPALLVDVRYMMCLHANTWAFYKYLSPPCFRDLFCFNTTFLFWRDINKHYTVTSYHGCVSFYQRSVPYTSDVCINTMGLLQQPSTRITAGPRPGSGEPPELTDITRLVLFKPVKFSISISQFFLLHGSPFVA